MKLYLLTVRRYSGVKCMLFYSEQKVLRRMRLWAKHPECISAEITPLQTGETTMFKKKLCPKIVYDALLSGNEFLRITTNLNGEYVLFHCYGLAENGITPLRSDRVCSATTLRECKDKAQELYAQKPVVKQERPEPDYSHVRLPYKD